MAINNKNFEEDESVICVNIDLLEGNTIAPPLVLPSKYIVKNRHVCECGQEHIDVGLNSLYEYIRL